MHHFATKPWDAKLSTSMSSVIRVLTQTRPIAPIHPVLQITNAPYGGHLCQPQRRRTKDNGGIAFRLLLLALMPTTKPLLHQLLDASMDPLSWEVRSTLRRMRKDKIPTWATSITYSANLKASTHLFVRRIASLRQHTTDGTVQPMDHTSLACSSMRTLFL